MHLRFYGLAAGVLAIQCALAQQKFTAADYQRAEKMMTYNTSPLVARSGYDPAGRGGLGIRPNWMAGDAFWYRVTTLEGSEFVLVDPAKGTRAPAFDHAKVAAALGTASGRTIDPHKLPFTAIEFSDDRQTITVQANGRWTCDVAGVKCVATEGDTSGRSGRGGRGGRGGGRDGANATPESMSPDGKHAAFIRDWNLWVRDVATGKETQMTTDGVKDFGYATDNAGWSTSNRPILLWSPDSKRIATFQQDQRNVGEMYLVETKVGHPTLRAWKYPLPGDEVVPTISRVVMDLDGPRVTRLRMPPDQHRSTLCDHVACRGGEWADVEWNADGSRLAFVSTSRDHRTEVLRIANATTGEVRDVLKEEVPTFFESGNGRVNWHYLDATHEVIWFSERDNWGQLYLYDSETGKLKNQITTGEGNVTQVIRVDAQARVIYFLGVGKEKGRDPYFVHLYRIGFDGKGLALLTPEDGNHDVTLSPSGKYFTDSYSKPDVPAVAVARDNTGKPVANLEKADISKLTATGWKPPMPFTVKARDGVTDLYGLLFRPTNFDASKKYPIVNHIYPGPQTGSVGSRNFSPARGDCQALAELGFIVVEIDGMGTPWRSKKFHETYFGNLGDNTLPDQVTGMQQLAKRYPWIDLDRAGIYGHSGGGFATADAMFRYPDFFKVGISEAGNHDNREYEDDWGEKWQGLLKTNADGTTNYDNQANQLQAKNLKGKLLLAHGTMDNNVPPYNTLLVVNELIQANKDFDLLMLPNRNHGFGNEAYMVRRRWDYFVRNLLGAEPPAGYELKPPPGGGRGGFAAAGGGQ
ncbi:MAG TPA: DPP IV N-terminal domain-containing protein [Candidatus Solibacter sp.]|nr:DPP IV N-terminal domain-containing protein [Candidatus Solibacter sp.]